MVHLKMNYHFNKKVMEDRKVIKEIIVGVLFAILITMAGFLTLALIVNIK